MKMAKIAMILALVAVSVAMGESQTLAQTRPTLIAKGRQLLDKNCSRCHAIGIEGASSHAQAPPFRDVVKRYPPESLAEALAEGIMSGHPDMPEIAFAPDEIDGIVNYLDNLASATKP